jgi:hypothetical protein
VYPVRSPSALNKGLSGEGLLWELAQAPGLFRYSSVEFCELSLELAQACGLSLKYSSSELAAITTKSNNIAMLAALVLIFLIFSISINFLLAVKLEGLAEEIPSMHAGRC